MTDPSRRQRPRWWIGGLAAVFVLALGVRVANVTVWYPSCSADIIAKVEANVPYAECSPDEYRIWGDAGYYYLQGYLLSNGHVYADGATWFATNGQRIVPSAGDPPAFSAWVALMFKLGLRGSEAQRLATSVLGAAGIVGLSLVAARLAGGRAGLLAGTLGAVSPMLFINDGMLLSESLYVPAITLVLLAAYRFWDSPVVSRSALLGAAIAFAALTRGEALLVFGALVLPLLWRLRDTSWRQRAVLGATCWAVGGALVAPWVLFNMSRFEEPVLMTSQTGAVLSAGTCDVAWYGEALGYYGADCYADYIRKGYPVGNTRLPGCTTDAAAALDSPDPVVKKQADPCWPSPTTYDESERDKIITGFAVRYIGEHKRRLPVVMAARVGRMFDLYNPEMGADPEPLGQNVRFNWAVEGRGKWQSRIAFVEYFALVPFAVIALLALKRRRLPLSPLLALPAVITVTAALAFGVTRYRVPVDLVLVLLGGVAIDHLLRRRCPVRADDDGTVAPMAPAGGSDAATTLTDPEPTSPPADPVPRRP